MLEQFEGLGLVMESNIDEGYEPNQDQHERLEKVVRMLLKKAVDL